MIYYTTSPAKREYAAPFLADQGRKSLADVRKTRKNIRKTRKTHCFFETAVLAYIIAAFHGGKFGGAWGVRRRAIAQGGSEKTGGGETPETKDHFLRGSQTI